MNKRYGLLEIVIVSFFVAFVFFTPKAGADSGENNALQLYHQAIAAKTIGERQTSLEKALKIYMARFNEMKDRGEMNGLLCYNIGNCYFNLGQIGEAIYYYKAGLKLMPGNEIITANLRTALNKREHPVDIESGGIEEIILFFHYKIGTKARIDILIVTSVLTALMLIGLMIKSGTALKYITGIFVTVTVCLFASIGVEYYMPEHEGVILRTTDVRKGPDTGFAPVTSHPFGEGSGIQVLSLNDGWYKVKLNDGRKGYVLRDHLRIVI